MDYRAKLAERLDFSGVFEYVPVTLVYFELEDTEVQIWHSSYTRQALCMQWIIVVFCCLVVPSLWAPPSSTGFKWIFPGQYRNSSVKT